MSDITPKEIAQIRVYVDMVGDLFHAGHIELLKMAREFGNWLIVGVLPDDVVQSYKRLPIMNLDERVAVIEACRYVDEVISNAPDVVTLEFLNKHRIATVVHGDDLSKEAIEKVFGQISAAGKLRLVPRTSDISTTEIIRRIQSRA